jgi:Holliday junction resolvase-like predicted endonuclease
MGTRSREVGFPPVLARFIFAIVNFAAGKGLGATPLQSRRPASPPIPPKIAPQTGVRGETYAYWNLRHGYILVARNFTSPQFKGEIVMVRYDGATLALVEVKTRAVVETPSSLQPSQPVRPTPEEAVNWEKRRNISRLAGQFLRARPIEKAACRFDVLAGETRPDKKPVVRPHQGACNAGHH